MVAPVKANATPDPALVAAVRALTNRDADGASVRNGVGWSGFDSHSGHALASIPPEEWGAKATFWAWQATHKYRRQLAAIGIDWDALPHLPLVPEPGSWLRERQERLYAERQRDIQEERADRDYQQFLRDKERQQQGQQRQQQGRMVYLMKDHPENVVIVYKYDPVLKDTLKASVIGLRWDGEEGRRYWWAAITPESAPGILALGDKFGFGFAAGVMEILQAIVGRAAALEVASKAAQTEFRFDGLLREPYPFQWAGIEYAVKAQRTFIADDRGLGKTIQAIGTAHYLKSRINLVLCPANVKYNWRNEINATLANQTVCLVEGMRPWPIYPEADWYVMNHNITSAHLAVLCEQYAIDCLIIDEGHYLSNPKASRTKAVEAICGDIPYRLILTGTAIVNRPKELIPQLKILGRLKDIAKSEWDFKKRFCGLVKEHGHWNDNGSGESLELNKKMRQVCFPAGTLVSTRYGMVPIDVIVEKELEPRVLSFDLSTGAVEEKRVVAHSRVSYVSSLVRVIHECGEFSCTPDHRVWTEEQGYVAARDLGDHLHLWGMWQQGDESQVASIQGQVLLPLVRRSGQEQESRGNSGQHDNASREAWPGHNEDLCLLRGGIYRQGQSGGQEKEILHPPVLKSVAWGTTGSPTYLCRNVGKIAEDKGSEAPGHWGETSGTQDVTRECREDARETERTQLPRAGGQAEDHPPADCPPENPRGARFRAGVSDHGREGDLSGGHRYAGGDDSDRGGRIFAPREATAGTRCIQDAGTYRSRVVRVEILEPGDRCGRGECGEQGTPVYDIEVEDNHNFYANGILVSNCYIRREKLDVLSELPPKRRIVLDVPLTNYDEYRQAEDDLVNWMANKAVDERRFRAQIAHMEPWQKKIEIDRRREESKNKTSAAEALVRFNALKRLAAQGKIESVKEWIADFLAGGQKLVVFAWYRETVDELCKALEQAHGGKVPHIHGGDTALARQQTVERFQSDPTCRLLVCNIIAAGEGITLTAAQDVFFAEMGWNPGKQDQAEDRIHRIGQKGDTVTAWYMLANETIEADIYDIIANKRIVTTAVNEGRELPESERSMMREIAGRLRKRHAGGQQALPLELEPQIEDDSPPWDE